MSDWQVGDLAVCVDVEPRPCKEVSHDGSWNQPGSVIRVTAIYRRCCGCRMLRWGAGARELGLAVRYRKIRPDEHEACETEFVTLLKRSKRKVSA